MRVRSSQAKEMIEELDRQMSLVLRENTPNKFDWFSEFKQKDDLLQFYEYEQLPQFNKIMNLNRVDQEFFDLRFHFKATLLVKNEPKTYHVTLNEGAVLKSFLSSKVDLFNMPKFSAFYRWTFAKFQNNECVIESFISIADNQSFDNQKDETLEDRLIIKCNSDTFASTREISQAIATMYESGNEDWKIHQVTLPITYGRYQNEQSLVFESIKSQKCSKHSYIFRMLKPEYQSKMKIIAQNYK